MLRQCNINLIKASIPFKNRNKLISKNSIEYKKYKEKKMRIEN